MDLMMREITDLGRHFVVKTNVRLQSLQAGHLVLDVIQLFVGLLLLIQELLLLLLLACWELSLDLFGQPFDFIFHFLFV